MIIDMQRRLREIGRLRIGTQVPTGNGKTRPEKLLTFRLTSRDRHVIDAAAETLGGKVEPWEAPDGDQWEVVTNAAELPVIVPPGEMAFSQFYEQWSAGGCLARCDGQWDTIADKACHCDPTHRDCAIHTRLSVMLPSLPGLGVWRLDTSGYYAAVELGGAVDICRQWSESGRMLPARLRLEQRSVKRPGANGKPVTMRFAVPVLDVDVHLSALAGSAPVAIGPSVAEIAAPGFQPVPVDSLPAGPQPSIAEQAVAPGPRPKRVNSAPTIAASGLDPRTAAQAAGEPDHIADVRRALATLTDAERMSLKAWWKETGVSLLKSDDFAQVDARAVLGEIARLIAERPVDDDENAAARPPGGHLEETGPRSDDDGGPAGPATSASTLSPGDMALSSSRFVGGTGSPEVSPADEEQTQQASPGRLIDPGEESAPRVSGTGSDPGDRWGRVPPDDAARPEDIDERPPTEAEIRDVAILADKVFKAAYDAAPKGDKGKARDRLRHALTFATTSKAHLHDLSMAQLIRVDGKLREIERGTVEWDLTDAADGVIFTTPASGERIVVFWAQVEGAG